MDLALEPTVSGAILAAAAVAGGAPLFRAGLRTLRLRRHLLALGHQPLAAAPAGFVHTSGAVTLDSPLFAPLSGQPCAGFRLEVHGPGTAATIEARRAFRIVQGGVSARIVAREARWEVGETARREFRPGEPMSENLAALLAGCPEARWILRRGHTLVLIERALRAGCECHVIGQARHARPYELPAEVALERTGTDGALAAVTDGAAVPDATAAPLPSAPLAAAPAPPPGERRRPGRPYLAEADLWVDGGGVLDFLLVADARPAPAAHAAAAWRALGVALGPAISLAGLLYLAHAADRLRATGRF